MADALEFCVKWSGKEYMITALTAEQTVSDMKIMIHKETGVLPERQKLLGLKFKGKYIRLNFAIIKL
jgi:ubiquitin-like domain-containing CTD phosphatase 1